MLSDEMELESLSASSCRVDCIVVLLCGSCGLRGVCDSLVAGAVEGIFELVSS